ncbi:MAG TPA: hypothetical protein VGM74_12530 [Burkholderiaceae bacterium]|jgi:hypothetical protein
MSASQPPGPYSPAARQAIADAIEWEELPSLVRRVQRTAQAAGQNAGAGAARQEGRPWGETAAGGLEAPPVSQPFVEQLHGLVTREVVEPDVFRHFFGPDAE